MPRPIVPAPRTVTLLICTVASPVRMPGAGIVGPGSGRRDRVHAGGALGERGELVGDGERGARGLGRRGLQLGRDAVLLEQLAPEAVVEDLLGLDDVAVEVRGGPVAGALAQGDEL